MTPKRRTKTWQLDTDYRPHQGQVEVHACRARYRVLICGRQWGKSFLSMNELAGTFPGAWRGAMQRPGGTFWFVTRTHRLAKKSYRQCKRALQQLIASDRYGRLAASDTELRIELVNGAVLEFRSADNPDLLRGATLDGLVLDEVTLHNERLWTEVLDPACAVKKAWVLFTGTARGAKHWIYPLHLYGLDDADPAWKDWKSWGTPQRGRSATENPFFGDAEAERARLSLPEAYFKQEYLAEFLDDAVGFFGGLDAAYDGKPAHSFWTPGWAFYLGVDLAKAEDYTVAVTVGRHVTGDARIVDMERWHGTSWKATKRRILAIAERWRVHRAVVDQTGVGDPVVEDLCRERACFEGFTFTAQSKEILLKGLAVDIEAGRIRLPGSVQQPAFPQLDGELRSYGWHPNKAGKLVLGPSGGQRDDCVMAAGLACRAARRSGPSVDLTRYQQPIIDRFFV